MEQLFLLNTIASANPVASPYLVGEVDREKTSSKAQFYTTYDANTRAPIPFLYKEYTKPNAIVRSRIQEFQQYVDYFQGKTQIKQIVPALPHAAVQRGTDESQFGIVVTNVQRSADTKTLEQARFNNLDLRSRLLITASLARQVASLHNAHIIHSDINYHNILFHNITFRPPIDLIDMDWAAVSDANNRYYGSLVPANMVFEHSNFLAPELRSGSNQVTFSSDLWGLAMAIHYILLTPRDPFILFTGMEQQDILDRQMPWPPESVVTGQHKRHRSAFLRLDVILMEMFRQCFDRRYGKDFYPHLRPKASEWMTELTRAMDNIKVCHSCKESYVGMYNRRCPICVPEGKVVIAGGQRIRIG